MRYMGGKSRVAKHIVELLNQHRSPGQLFVEPFLGGCNILPNMENPRMASDNNKDIIAFYKGLQGGWVPPTNLTDQEYFELKNSPKPSKEKGFAGIAGSFGGRYFMGNRVYADIISSFNTAIKTQAKINGVRFLSKSYKDLKIPDNSLVYCDPPYAGTTGYTGFYNTFDSNEFWQWVRDLSKRCTVFVSEYNAPSDFKCVLKIDTNTCIKRPGEKSQKRTEKVFIYKKTKALKKKSDK